jgi:hypothetical protein
MNLLYPFVPERHFLEVPLPPKPATSNLSSHKVLIEWVLKVISPQKCELIVLISDRKQ